MSKFRYYIVLIRRHHRYGDWRQALDFAWRHRSFWRGAEGTPSSKYNHIGSGKPPEKFKRKEKP